MDAVRPFTSSNRKIDPARRRATQLFKPDGSPLDPDRIEIGPTDLAFSEWADLGITPPNLDRMRQTRLERTVAEIQRRDLGGVLLFDPLNIRYASDSSNMHLWITHNPARAVFVGVAEDLEPRARHIAGDDPGVIGAHHAGAYDRDAHAHQGTSFSAGPGAWPS